MESQDFETGASNEKFAKQFENIRKHYSRLVEIFPKPKQISVNEIDLYGKQGVIDEEKELGYKVGRGEEYFKKDTSNLDAYKKHDPDLSYLMSNMLASRVRGGIGESFGLNFQTDFLSNPDELSSESHEPWYDIMGVVRYVKSMVRNKYFQIEESKREELSDVVADLENSLIYLLETADTADPNALAYGMAFVSSDTKEMLWRMIAEKYTDQVSLFALERIVRDNRENALSNEAWDKLKIKDDIPLIILYRIAKDRLPSDINKEAAQMLFNKVLMLEEYASAGNTESLDELKVFGYEDGTEGRYARFKAELEEMVNS